MTLPAATPRLAKEKATATGIGFDLATFREWVASGLLPGPIEGTDLFDMKAMDAALDRLSGIGALGNALDAWRAKNNAR